MWRFEFVLDSSCGGRMSRCLGLSHGELSALTWLIPSQMRLAFGFLSLVAVVFAQTTTTPRTTTPPCALTQWNQWLSCGSLACQAGSESRSRSFVNIGDSVKPECADLARQLVQERCVTDDCKGLCSLLLLFLFFRSGLHLQRQRRTRVCGPRGPRHDVH
jgi:hypothetical protein